MESRGYEHFSPDLLEKVARLEFKARLVVEGALSGMHKSPYRGFNVEFLEHREYYPGDDLRHVDWKLFGKRDKFFVKQFEEDTNLRTYILLDSSASMRFGEGEHGSKLKYASLLAAGLAYLFIKQGDLAGALSRFGEQIKRRSLVVLISDLLDDPAPVLAAIKTLRRRQSEMVLFHLLDRAEVDLPYNRASRFLDMETGGALSAEPAVIRAEYQRNLARHVDLFRAFCRRQTIEFIHAVTDTPVEKVLLGYLQQRERRKRVMVAAPGRPG